MKRAFVALSVVCVLGSGCGGGGDAMEGTWVLDLSSTCLFGLTFDGGDLESDLVCQLEGGGLGMEARLGTYTVDGDTLVMTITHSTCPGETSGTDRVGFEIDGDTLTIADTSGVVALTRLEDNGMPGSAAAEFGCFDFDTGLFEPFGLTRL